MKAYTIADEPNLVWTDPEAFKRFAVAPLIYGSDNRKADFDSWMKMSADDIAKHRDTAGTYSILDDYKQKEGDWVNPSLRDLYNSKDDTDPFDEEIYSLTDKPEENMYEDLIKNAPEEFLDEDELIDYILSNYDGPLPEDDATDEAWAEFYADGSPFRDYEDALRAGLKDRIKQENWVKNYDSNDLDKDENGNYIKPSEEVEVKEEVKDTDEPHDEKTVKESKKSEGSSDKEVEKILDKVGTQVMDNVIDEHIDKSRKAGASFTPRSKTSVKAMLDANKKGVKLSDENEKDIKEDKSNTCVSDRTMKNIIGTLSQYRW